MTDRRFPFLDRPRLWGVAVSHYQVEGDDSCDWTEWEAAGRTKGESCGPAVGAWARYEDDALLAKSIGANSFRFSISWSRVEPRPGWFHDAALARYRRFVEFLIAHEMEPVITLFHYTHPAWFHRQTPWSDGRSREAFGRFAKRVIDEIGDQVRCWTILNEPLVYILAAYVDGQIPPGVSNGRLASSALENLLGAHAIAAARIRERNPRAAIGIAHNMMSFSPERRGHPLDSMIARIAHRFYNASLLPAFRTGEWNLFLPPWTFIRGKNRDLVDTLDFAGINYYSRLHLRCPGRQRLVGDFRYLDRAGGGLTDNGWEIVPADLEPLIVEASKHGLPIVITENGLADGHDLHRARFLHEHVSILEKLRDDHGIDVHGYFHWSLLDNYEWLDGYDPKFGLASVDRRTMERKLRPSASVFRDLGRRFIGADDARRRHP